LSNLVRIADALGQIHPYLRVAIKVGTFVFNAVKDQLDRDEHILALVDTMTTLYSFVSPLDVLKKEHFSIFSSLEDIIKKILKQTVECMLFIQEYGKHSFGVKALSAQVLNTDKQIDIFRDAFAGLANSLDTGIAAQTAIVSLRQGRVVEEINLRGKLNPIETERVVARRERCHPKTRLQIVDLINDWVFDDSDGASNVFWLHGVAGSGKSSIAATIVDYFADQGRLGGSIFFDRNAAQEDNNPYRFITTLAFQLSQFDSRIQERIAVAADRKAQLMQPEAQFRELVQQPLTSSIGQLQEGPIVIVVDGLDECGVDDRASPYFRGSLLKALTRTVQLLPPTVRVLITSRAVPDIETALSKIKNIHIASLEASEHSHEDIAVYIRDKMADIAQDNDLSDDWPGSAKISALAERADGLFIWAVTACSMIEDGSSNWHSTPPQQILDSLIDGSEKISLETLYDKALHSSCDRYMDEPDFERMYRDVLGTILTAKEPISPSAIERILHPTKLDRFLSSLRSVLRISSKPDEPVHLLHLSFRDFVTTESRCDPRWFVNVIEYNERLAKICLETILNPSLPVFDRAELDRPLAELALDETTAYACSFWIVHICEIKRDAGGLERQVLEFLRRHFLHWLEAMSILGRSRDTAGLLDRLLGWVEVSTSVCA